MAWPGHLMDGGISHGSAHLIDRLQTEPFFPRMQETSWLAR